ncbi:MAG: hypothetical protein Q8O67_13765 [Deltaproteobacteria bacterium]|nr:hypothetical protein [Deltaproteobacteria bacterium]
MRRNLTAILLTFGVVAGFGSGIASCSRGHWRGEHGRESCDHAGKAAKEAVKAAAPTTTPTTTPLADPAPVPPPPAEPAPAPVEPAPAPEG